MGDVIVGTRTIEHDYRERFNPRPAPSYQSEAAALTGLEHAVAALELDFRVHFGPIASGDDLLGAWRSALRERGEPLGL